MGLTRRNLIGCGCAVAANTFLSKAAMCNFPAPAVEQYAAPLTGTGPINGFNYYTMVDRSFVIPANRGPVCDIGLYSTMAGQWRPKLIQDFGYDGYSVVYSHPQMVSHTGSGWEWVKVPRISPNGAAPAYAGAYFNGFGHATMAMAPGPRSEGYGDLSGPFIATSGNFATPAMGVRCVGIKTPVAFFTHFDTPGWRDGASSYGLTWSVANSIYSVANFNDDENHTDGIGVLSLLIFITRLGVIINGVHKKADLRNARVVARVRGIDYDPKQSQVYPWIQGRHPTDLTKTANWAMTSMPLNDKLTSGNWETIDVTLDPTAEWTYAGNNLSQPNPERYSFLPLADTFVNGENFHFPAVRPVGTPKPTGTVEWDYIGITYADVA